MRTPPHDHPCQACGTDTECAGVYEQNYDGWPEAICPDFHLSFGRLNADFLCPDCADKAADIQTDMLTGAREAPPQ